MELYTKLVIETKTEETGMIKRAVEDCANKLGLDNQTFGQ